MEKVKWNIVIRFKVCHLKVLHSWIVLMLELRLRMSDLAWNNLICPILANNPTTRILHTLMQWLLMLRN